MRHEYKTWPGPFQAIVEGRKRFEIRRHDRPFLPSVGDTLHLREWRPAGYTGREVEVVVSYVVAPGEWGLPADLMVLGIGAPVTFIGKEPSP